MTELSLNVLDIAQNSVVAGAKLIEITVSINTVADRMIISIKDDGKGMDNEALQKAQDPFFTTRTTRKVGLGVPLFKMSAEMTGGSFRIESRPGEGTLTEAAYAYSHIDRMPLGDMASTISTLVSGNESIDFIFTYQKDSSIFCLDTRELREVMAEIPLSSREVLEFIYNQIDSAIKATETEGNLQ